MPGVCQERLPDRLLRRSTGSYEPEIGHWAERRTDYSFGLCR
jgi:hypothetical protein